MILSALLAFFLALAALRDTDQRVRLAMVARTLAAGEEVAPDDFSSYEVTMGGDALPGLLTLSRAQELAGSGYRTGRALPGGTLVTESDLLPESTLGPRTMSFPIDRARAVGGRVSAGDRIDLISVEQGSAGFVLTGAPVVAVSDVTGAGRTYWLTIELSAADSLRLARALSAGSLSVVKATWAPPADPGLTDPPPATVQQEVG